MTTRTRASARATTSLSSGRQQGQPGTTIQIFPADDHFFFPGSGPSGPRGTMAPGQHMDPEVIDEIVAWLAP